MIQNFEEDLPMTLENLVAQVNHSTTSSYPFSTRTIHRADHIYFCPDNYPDFYTDILTIIPLEHTNYRQSFILYEDKYQIVNLSGAAIIDEWLATINLKYSQFCQIFEDSTEKMTYLKPCTDKYFVLFPTTSQKKKDTIWLNPLYIRDIKRQNLQSEIEFINGFRLPCFKKKQRLIENMTRAVNLLILSRHVGLPDKQVNRSKPIQIADALHFPKDALIRNHLGAICFTPHNQQSIALEKIYLHLVENNH